MTTPPTWTRYTVANEAEFRALIDLPNDDEFAGGTVFPAAVEYPTDEEYRAAGFDPADEETDCVILLHAYNGHPAGSRVICGLAVNGHPFAIEAVPS